MFTLRLSNRVSIRLFLMWEITAICLTQSVMGFPLFDRISLKMGQSALNGGWPQFFPDWGKSIPFREYKIKTPFSAVGCGAHLRKVPVRNKRPILRLPPFSDDLTKTFPASRLVFLPCPFIFASSFPNQLFSLLKRIERLLRLWSGNWSRFPRSNVGKVGMNLPPTIVASFFAPRLWEAHLKFWKDIIKENLLGRLVRKRKNNICGQRENASEEKP